MTQEYSIHPKYRADVDGLRAIAILSVVIFHYFPQWLTGGFVGVDVFFVISGYLISSIIFGNLEKNSFSYFDFYARRIKRIFPALILVLIASYSFGWFLLLPEEFKFLGKHIAAGAGFVSNLALWNEAGYFDNASDTKPLLHLWSLGIEEQFYIFWPILLGIVWKYRLNFVTITIGIAVASFSLNIFFVSSNPVADFYSPLTRFWELMIGGVLAYFTLHKPHFLPKNTNHQSAIGLALIIISILSINKTSAFPGWWALLPTLGAFLIISSHPNAWINRYVLGNRVMVSIGLISYPLYLWHWPILSYLRITNSGPPSMEIRITAILASVFLAWLTYWAIEKPIRFKSNANRKIIVLCTLLILIGLIGFNTYKRDGLSFRLMLIMPEFTGKRVDYVNDWRLNQCFLEIDKNKFSDVCVDRKKPLVLLWGDSHAAALYAGFKNVQPSFQFGIAQFTSMGCKPLVGKDFTDVPLCKSINDDILSITNKLKPEYVILHANWSNVADLKDLEVTINALKTANIEHIVLLGPDPIWNDDLPRIVFNYYRKEHIRPPLRMKENKVSHMQDLESSMRNFADLQKIKYISSIDILCNQEGCLTRTDADSSDIFSMDDNHLTPPAASYEARFLLRNLFQQSQKTTDSSATTH